MARTAEEILDKKIPLTECTEEEINAVVEYRAAILSRDSEYSEKMANHEAMMTAVAARFGAVADKCEAELAAHATDAAARLDAACKYAKEVRA